MGFQQLPSRLRRDILLQPVLLAPLFYVTLHPLHGQDALFPRFGIWSLLFLPPVYLIYCSYRSYVDHLRRFAAQVKSDIAQIEQLSNLNQSLISSPFGAVDAAEWRPPGGVNRCVHFALALADAAGVAGAERTLLAAAAGAGGAPRPARASSAPRISGQHERWDGIGQPGGRRGEEIPITGRIFAIVAMFDLLTSERPYRRALPPRDAVRVLDEGAGRQFDPRLVELFHQVWPRAWREVHEMEVDALLADPQPSPADRPSGRLPAPAALEEA